MKATIVHEVDGLWAITLRTDHPAIGVVMTAAPPCKKALVREVAMAVQNTHRGKVARRLEIQNRVGKPATGGS